MKKNANPSNSSLLDRVSRGEEVFWLNDKYNACQESDGFTDFSREQIDDAARRLERFAPVLMHYFPETTVSGGIIESPLTEIAAMKTKLCHDGSMDIPGRMFLKQDSHLAISGSVKARGGIYEVLKHTEDLALEHGLISSYEDDYRKLTAENARKLFSQYRIQVGSTGNLGLSIGIMSAALGYEAIIHMSIDARQWKKDMLRERGATVIEYAGDYEEAVKKGRAASEQDPFSYFVDDENSRELFCGYAVAGRRLKAQLEELRIPVDGEHPLIVMIPCGVGGAPGGITYGLKQCFGEHVHVFFAEPTQAPCMLIGLETGKYGEVAVQDFGLTGRTEADGLAVGRCSTLVARNIHTLLSGEATVWDERLGPFMRDLWETENIYIEPSACAAFAPLIRLYTSDAGRQYFRVQGLEGVLNQAINIVWATGGSMVPEQEKNLKERNCICMCQ